MTSLDPKPLIDLGANLSLVRRDPRTLTNLPEILSCLSSFQSEEAELSKSLAGLLNAREPIIASLHRLRLLIPQLDNSRLGAFLLCQKVSTTAQTAERVGSRVRALDEEMGRVREAGDRVGQTMELKSSLNALQAAIDAHDWEAAARHCAKAMSIPIEVTSGPFAEQAVPTAESHLPPAQTLQTAREKLLTIFRQNFEQASRFRDSTATSRFFKLFPAIGWEVEGLEAYAAFVVDLVRVRAPASAKTSSPLYYITALTSLFESIAMIVDHHQPVVDKYYGSGKMRFVVRRLLEESDRVTKPLNERWEEDRSIQRKVAEVLSNPPASLFSAPRKQQNIDDALIDPREIDKALSEIAGMVGRWNLFRKFLTEALKESVIDDESDDALVAAPVVCETQSIDQTAAHVQFEGLITSYYIPFEVWYTRTIIDKAHRISTPDPTQTPLTTTTPDDVFYILKSVTSRLLTTGSLTCVKGMLEALLDIVDRDYIGIIKKKLDDVYRNPTLGGNTRPERAEKEHRIVFITLLNDLDVSASHLELLTHDLYESPLIPQHFLNQDQILVRQLLTSLSVLMSKFRSTIRAGVEQLFNQLMRPRLRNLIPDVYKDVSYILDDENYVHVEYQDLTRKRFIKAWEILVDGYKDTFSDGNYRMFFGLALDLILKPWEKYVVGLKFTELGAIRFDRDLRAIIAYLSSQTAFGDVREKFLRLQQISTLLNLDGEENVDGFYNGSGIPWKLTIQEARLIANLKF